MKGLRMAGAVVLLPLLLVGMVLMSLGDVVSGLWTRTAFTKEQRKAIGVKFAVENALRHVVALEEVK